MEDNAGFILAIAHSLRGISSAGLQTMGYWHESIMVSESYWRSWRAFCCTKSKDERVVFCEVWQYSWTICIYILMSLVSLQLGPPLPWLFWLFCGAAEGGHGLPSGAHGPFHWSGKIICISPTKPDTLPTKVTISPDLGN